VFEDSSLLHGRFRHFNAEPITLEPGIDRALNLGVRLYRSPGKKHQIFEDRMITDGRPIEPGVWASVSVRLPRSVINFRDRFRIVADMVKEDEFWFAAYGHPVAEVEVSFVDGLADPDIESIAVEPNITAQHEERFSTTRATGQIVAEMKSLAAVHLVFDVSDLIQYFHHARLPTGIQRVQIEVITSLIFSLPEECSLKIGCFTKQADDWIEIQPLFFNHICKLALVNGDQQAADWLRVLEELRMNMEQAKRLVFQRGAYLINLGTSWWLQNYFLHVRAAKARYGIRYVPYVHDCIPIMMPEHCVERLTRDFITWALGAFQHADHIMVNSKATAADVKLVAGQLGHRIDEPSVVTLDADYRAATARLPPDLGASANPEIFLKHDIRPGAYVLFVSTIESRKNHLMAFSAWLSLAKKHGPRNVPRLVCVGNRGWLNDAIYAKLSASKILQQKVTMLSRISDPDLEQLYRNCLFTIYPSSYEGWGLPVTESLCFGKVPVLANGSSLPEAGGKFGEYFDLGSEADLLRVLNKIIFDSSYREAREKEIAAHFRPRSWTTISEEIVALTRGWAAVDEPTDKGKEILTARGLWSFPVQLGRFYGLYENEHSHIFPGMVDGELFRQGDGWWWTEPWGCWTKAKVACLSFLAPINQENGAVLYFGVKGLQGASCVATIALEGFGKRRVNLEPEQTRWLIFRLEIAVIQALPRLNNDLLFEIYISSNKSVDFRESTAGDDHRVTSIGVTGFMICSDTDIASRLNFTESVSLNDLSGIVELREFG
jgi:glycosyltransferase involved in cell wall biosynthesis